MGDDNMRLRLQQQGAVLSSQLKVNDDDKVTQNEKGKKDARPIMSRNSFLCFILTNFLLLAYVLFFSYIIIIVTTAKQFFFNHRPKTKKHSQKNPLG
mmetsp:Transcript_14429/g.21161  ORF Transcript_14429/g.21161 Transcript_14429/m.21161 type:complete len:97 (-) Transcript_14429:911-1201(-)